MPVLRCKVLSIDDKKDVSKVEGKPFEKMEIVCESTVEVNGNDYTEHWPFQVTGDRIAKFDNIHPGDIVDIKYGRKGFIYKKKDDIAKSAKNPQHIAAMSQFEVSDCVKVSSASMPSSHPVSGTKSDDDLPF